MCKSEFFLSIVKKEQDRHVTDNFLRTFAVDVQALLGSKAIMYRFEDDSKIAYWANIDKFAVVYND